MDSKVLFLLCIVCFSCTKKNLSVLSPSIHIGNVETMEVKTIETTILSTTSLPGILKIDLNDDGEDDLEYAISWAGNAATGYYATQQLSILNDKTNFAASAYKDTTYIRFDTMITQLGGGKVEIKRKKTYLFTRSSPSDSFVSANNFLKASIMDSGDTFSRPFYFISKGPALLEDNFFTEKTDTAFNDTTYTSAINGAIRTDPYPLNKKFYFGFRHIEDGLVRLGWIKFIITAKGEAKIIETAIQKD